MPSTSVKDVNQHEFVKALAAHLKKSAKLKVPEWVDVVKTGIHKELAPYDDYWFLLDVIWAVEIVKVKQDCLGFVFTAELQVTGNIELIYREISIEPKSESIQSLIPGGPRR